MDYIFILGSNPTLSLAEISAVLGMETDLSRASMSTALVKSDQFSPAELMDRLAGVKKIGRVIGSFNEYDREEMANFISSIMGQPASKVKFGISVYSLNYESLAQKMIKDLESIGLEVKKRLKAEGVSSRYVSSKGHELSSVGVHENKLLESGGEFLLIATREGLIVGQTEVVQDYKAWSHRDFDKPARDAKRGMLPPKLARTMVNLAIGERQAASGRPIRFLDPFCGIGTTLMEARLVGVNQMLGSDIDEAAIDGAEENLNWFEEELGVDVTGIDLKVCDAQKFDPAVGVQHVEPLRFDVVVTEPLLGPPQKGNESKKWINDQIDELTRLYTKAFASIAKTMNPGARMIVTLPVFTHADVDQYLPIKKIIKGTKLSVCNLISDSVPQKLNKKTPHNGILYQRPGQHVGREIICLQK